MRRLLLVFLLVLAALAPAAEGAATNLYKYGINSSAEDITAIPDNNNHLDNYIAGGTKLHIRVAINCRYGLPGNTVAGDRLADMYGAGITPQIVFVVKGPTGTLRRPGSGHSESISVQAWKDCVTNGVWSDILAASGQGKVPSGAYEIWNEPNCGGGDFGRDISQYVTYILDPASDAIRAIGSNVNVVAGGVGFGKTDNTDYCTAGEVWVGYTDALCPGCVDAHALHPYGFTNSSAPHARGATLGQTVAKAQAEVDRSNANTTKPLLCNEVGRPTPEPTYFTQSQQQGYAGAIDNLAGCRTVSWYRVYDIASPNTVGNHMGLFGVNPYPAKLAWNVWSALPDTLVGTL